MSLIVTIEVGGTERVVTLNTGPRGFKGMVFRQMYNPALAYGMDDVVTIEDEFGNIDSWIATAVAAAGVAPPDAPWQPVVSAAGARAAGAFAQEQGEAAQAAVNALSGVVVIEEEEDDDSILLYTPPFSSAQLLDAVEVVGAYEFDVVDIVTEG